MTKRLREDKPLLICDIAGILLDGNAMMSKRKHLDQFLHMIFQNYHVVSWTSRKRYKQRKGKIFLLANLGQNMRLVRFDVMSSLNFTARIQQQRRLQISGNLCV